MEELKGALGGILDNYDSMRTTPAIDGDVAELDRLRGEAIGDIWVALLNYLEGFVCEECSTPNFIHIILPREYWQKWLGERTVWV